MERSKAVTTDEDDLDIPSRDAIAYSGANSSSYLYNILGYGPLLDNLKAIVAKQGFLCQASDGVYIALNIMPNMHTCSITFGFLGFLGAIGNISGNHSGAADRYHGLAICFKARIRLQSQIKSTCRGSEKQSEKGLIYNNLYVDGNNGCVISLILCHMF
ncbi:hypothetical protein ACJX0J_014657 [Zea mays]